MPSRYFDHLSKPISLWNHSLGADCSIGSHTIEPGLPLLLLNSDWIVWVLARQNQLDLVGKSLCTANEVFLLHQLVVQDLMFVVHLEHLLVILFQH